MTARPLPDLLFLLNPGPYPMNAPRELTRRHRSGGVVPDHPAAPPAAARAYGDTAADFLLEAADTIDNRAAQRDHAGGERSMRRAVDMFNAWRRPDCDALAAGDLSEMEGWVFMALLKLARARGGSYRRDDFVDGAAYIALAGECAHAENEFHF